MVKREMLNLTCPQAASWLCSDQRLLHLNYGKYWEKGVEKENYTLPHYMKNNTVFSVWAFQTCILIP